MDEDNESDDEDFSTGGITPEKIAADPWKNINKYNIYMQQLLPLMKVHLKPTSKKVHNGPMPNKALPSHLDSLPWEGGEKHYRTCPFIHMYRICDEHCSTTKIPPPPDVGDCSYSLEPHQ
jgi:hypothetical protein